MKKRAVEAVEETEEIYLSLKKSPKVIDTLNLKITRNALAEISKATSKYTKNLDKMYF